MNLFNINLSDKFVLSRSLDFYIPAKKFKVEIFCEFEMLYFHVKKKLLLTFNEKLGCYMSRQTRIR